jgi:hypothetical protein
MVALAVQRLDTDMVFRSGAWAQREGGRRDSAVQHQKLSIGEAPVEFAAADLFDPSFRQLHGLRQA